MCGGSSLVEMVARVHCPFPGLYDVPLLKIGFPALIPTRFVATRSYVRNMSSSHSL